MKNIAYLFLIFLLVMFPGSFGWAKDEPGQKEKKRVRFPAVAGQFYPAEEIKLAGVVRQFLKEGKGSPVSGRIMGLIAPHAGYIYSGPVAATGYRQIDPATKTVFVLAPSHRSVAARASIMDVDAYRTPLGDIPLSPIAATLRQHELFSPLPEMDHKEHSLEVQLPFLQERLKNFELVPITIGQVDPSRIAKVLLPYIGEDTLIVASSDLSHYYPYNKARLLDESCIRAITAMDFDQTAESEACGKIPVLVLMEIARQKGWQGKLIDYRNSGDTAGPPDQVVGYASIAFVRGGEGGTAKGRETQSKNTLGTEHTGHHQEAVSGADRKALLDLARRVIRNTLSKEKSTSPEDPSPYLQEKRGCFVTLHKKGQLRGCIGTISPEQRLCDCVKENAFNAAFRDPRFSPLSMSELDQIEIEISILTLPRQIKFSDAEDLKRQLRPGVDGVILSQGWHRATYLPQVWEQLPDKESFLQSLCQKAGLPDDAWKNPKTRVEIYQAIVFSESE
ncbi:MAG: AmmeMemoRadiSam system protein B [bacterium]